MIETFAAQPRAPKSSVPDRVQISRAGRAGRFSTASFSVLLMMVCWLAGWAPRLAAQTYLGTVPNVGYYNTSVAVDPGLNKVYLGSLDRSSQQMYVVDAATRAVSTIAIPGEILPLAVSAVTNKA